MNLDAGNPYPRRVPEDLPAALELTAGDLRCEVSAANAAAAGRVAEWTVLVYLAADCNLAHCLFENLRELKRVGSRPDCHLLAFFDGPLYGDAFLARLNADSPLSDDLLFRYLDVRSHDHAVLTGMIRAAQELYPSRKTALIAGGHGRGWGGALLDQAIAAGRYREPDNLRLPGGSLAACAARLQAQNARNRERLLRRIEAAGDPRRRLDLVVFDCCHMGNLEVVATLGPLAPVLVVSEDQVPGEGFAYEALARRLQQSPQQSPLELARALAQETKRRYDGGGGAGSPARVVTQAVLNSTALPRLGQAVARLAEAAVPDLATGKIAAAFEAAWRQAWRFEATGSVDLRLLAAAVGQGAFPAVIRAAAAEVVRCFDEPGLVAELNSPRAGAGGLTLYAPDFAQFDLDYLRLAAGLPDGLDRWLWLLAAWTQGAIGDTHPGHPLLAAFRRLMAATDAGERSR